MVIINNNETNEAVYIRVCSKLVFTYRGCKQSGLVLVFVLVFLAVISLLSVSAISSSRLQLILLSNQQRYNQAITKIINTKQLILSELMDNKYSEQILQLTSVLNSASKVPGQYTQDCGLEFNPNVLPITPASPNQMSVIKPITNYLVVIAIKPQDQSQSNTEIIQATQRIETLLLQQCMQLNHSGLLLVETSILTRVGTEVFSVSVTYHNTLVNF